MKNYKLIVFGFVLLTVGFLSAAPARAIGSAECTLKTNKSSYQYGDTITFTWTSSANASYAAFLIDNSGKDGLDLPGDKLETAGTAKVTASVTGNPVVVLEIFDSQGVGNACSVTVNISESDDSDEDEDEDEDELAEPRINFWSNTIKENGKVVEYHLTWEVKDAVRCVLSDGSYEYQVGVRGAKEVAPTRKTTYTLWCANDSGYGKDGPSDSEKIKLYPVTADSEDKEDSKDTTVVNRDAEIARLQALLQELIKQLIALLASQR